MGVNAERIVFFSVFAQFILHLIKKFRLTFLQNALVISQISLNPLAVFCNSWSKTSWS